jgi:nitrogen PTS system EIIA component
VQNRQQLAGRRRKPNVGRIKHRSPAGCVCRQLAYNLRRIFAFVRRTISLSAMTYLATILPADNVVLDLEVSSKKRAFEQAGLIFENNCGIARSTVSDNLFARERLGSTGLGQGVAVPHGRIKGLKAPLAAFVRLLEPIPFESPDGVPVSLLVFLLIPDHVTQQHLEILSEIAEMFSDDAFRAGLARDPDAAAAYARICNWQPNLLKFG